MKHQPDKLTLPLFEAEPVRAPAISPTAANSSPPSPQVNPPLGTLERPTLVQFVILSMLLHTLAIVLFGNTNGTGVRRGIDPWGSLDVTLQPPTAERSFGLRLDRDVETNLADAVRAPRAARATTALPRKDKRPAADAPGDKDVNRMKSAPPEYVPPAQLTPSAAKLPPLDALPRLDPTAPNEVDKPVAPPQRIAPPTLVREFAPNVEFAPREAPLVPTVPLERISPAKIERELAPAAVLVPREVPLVPGPMERVVPENIGRELTPPVEPAARETPMVPNPIQRIAPAQVERELVPTTGPAPRETPLIPAPLERVAPAKIERTLAVPVELEPREAPMVPAPLEPVAPAKVDRQLAPAVELAPREAPGVPPGRSERNPLPRIEREPALQTEPASPRQPFGKPDGEDELFQRRSDTVAPGAAPRIDLDAARKRAREIANEGSGSRAILPFPMPPKPERKSKEAIAIEKAFKPDCRTAYANLGLAAIVPLLWDSIGEGKCKW